VWGLGRHPTIGSNFFWYLKDPAGNFSEYYRRPGLHRGTTRLVEAVRCGRWLGGHLQLGVPPLPPSFVTPEDLAAPDDRLAQRAR